MQYVRPHTSTLFLLSFILALKWTVAVLGLSSIRDDMEDSKRDSEIVLRQVVNILLELASQRFDMSCANTKLKII